jgi:hypothetical protein
MSVTRFSQRWRAVVDDRNKKKKVEGEEVTSE